MHRVEWKNFFSTPDRGNDNWLIKYERTPEVDRQVEGEQGVSRPVCAITCTCRCSVVTCKSVCICVCWGGVLRGGSAFRFLSHLWQYPVLLFTKSVNSNFCAFWLAPITRNILGYSLFCDWSQNGILLLDMTVRKDEIWTMNEAATHTNMEEATSFGLSVFTGS